MAVPISIKSMYSKIPSTTILEFTVYVVSVGLSCFITKLPEEKDENPAGGFGMMQ